MWLLLTVVPGEGPKPAAMPARPEGAEWAAPPKVIEKLMYRSDGRGYIPDGNTHLFVLPAEGGTPRQVTSGAYDHGGTPSWTPDSDYLLFSANRNDDRDFQPRNSEVFEVSVATGEIRQLTDRFGPDGSPSVSPDGSKIAYTGLDDRFQGYQVTHLYVMNLPDGVPRRLTTDDEAREFQPTWSPDGLSIAFVTWSSEGGRSGG